MEPFMQPVTPAFAREFAQQTTPAIDVRTAYPLRADEWPLLGPAAGAGAAAAIAINADLVEDDIANAVEAAA
jgi:hypothetical protein